MEQIVSFKTSDGKVFTNELEAQGHETAVNNRATIEGFALELGATKMYTGMIRSVIPAWIAFVAKHGADAEAKFLADPAVQKVFAEQEAKAKAEAKERADKAAAKKASGATTSEVQPEPSVSTDSASAAAAAGAETGEATGFEPATV